jgi:uncharacterized protein (DUF488 family)
MFDNDLEKIRMQKLLFLFTQKQAKKTYDFIPYKYGCYSYSANADLVTMAQQGILSETDTHFRKIDTKNYLEIIKKIDRAYLQEIKMLYGNMDTFALMKHTYINFPYWATKSVKAESILSEEEMNKIRQSRPNSHQSVLFTIGYEGISLEEYLNRLLKNDIKVLVDVRNNPVSMKYGFSKNGLKRYCENSGIQYVHFPEVGIQSEQRTQLAVQSDYDKLFIIYRTSYLTKTKPVQNAILNLLKQYKRIALTCFEANIDQCHRKHLAEAIKGLSDFDYEIKHI